MASISVVMPVGNAERFLAEAIASVLSQSLADFELIVVLDAPADRSAAIAHELGERDSRIRVIGSSGKGIVDALNDGCAAARGNLVARLDADDRMRETRLDTQYRFMIAHPEVVAVGSSAVTIDEDSRVVGSLRVPVSDKAIRARMVRGNPFVHSSMMLRKAAIASAGAYRKDFPFVEDLDLWLRIARLGMLSNLPEPLVEHRRNRAGLSVRNDVQQRLNRHLCVLDWKCRAGLVDATTAERLRHDIRTLATRTADLEALSTPLEHGDLALFQRMLSHLGGDESRRLRRLVSRARKEGQIRRTSSLRFDVEFLASRIVFDRNARLAAGRLSGPVNDAS